MAHDEPTPTAVRKISEKAGLTMQAIDPRDYRGTAVVWAQSIRYVTLV